MSACTAAYIQHLKIYNVELYLLLLKFEDSHLTHASDPEEKKLYKLKFQEHFTNIITTYSKKVSRS
jgi:hypothetical protein